jgi:hypothetical protein
MLQLQETDGLPPEECLLGVYPGGISEPGPSRNAVAQRLRAAGSGYYANLYFPIRKLSMKDLISGSFNGFVSSFESPATS